MFYVVYLRYVEHYDETGLPTFKRFDISLAEYESSKVIGRDN
jgi:hypothetical protein